MTNGPRAARSSFPDWRFAPNIGGSPDVYEIENQALDRGGHVLDAMRALAPWRDRTLVDLGCGTGFWLPRYADEAAEVTRDQALPVTRLKRLGIFRGCGAGCGVGAAAAVVGAAAGIRSTGGGAMKGFSAGAVR